MLDTSTSFGPRQCAHAHADVHGDPANVVASDLALARRFSASGHPRPVQPRRMAHRAQVKVPYSRPDWVHRLSVAVKANHMPTGRFMPLSMHLVSPPTMAHKTIPFDAKVGSNPWTY